MMSRTRAGLGPISVLAVLAGVLATACTGQINGEARPDPAVTVATAPTGTSSSTTSTSRSSSSSSSNPSTSGRKVLCLLIPPITSAATKSVNDYLAVANVAKSPTPELVAAEQKAVADLTPMPGRLRTLPGLSTLPPSDSLATEVPAIATAVESVIAAIPLRKSAPFNAATDNYNLHLDAIRTTCTS